MIVLVNQIKLVLEVRHSNEIKSSSAFTIEQEIVLEVRHSNEIKS